MNAQDLIIGSTSTQSDLTQGKLVTLKNLVNNDNMTLVTPTSFTSAAPESALLTFAVNGSDTFFNLPGTEQDYVVVDDIITLHFLSASTTYNDVQRLIAAKQAFVVSLSNYADLTPTTSLTNLCSSDQNSNSNCYLRWDIRQREPVVQQNYTWQQARVTAMELNASNSQDAENFLAGIFSDSQYVRNLATSYQQVIKSTYSLNGRYKRAWWISPVNQKIDGNTWTPAKIIMVRDLL